MFTKVGAEMGSQNGTLAFWTRLKTWGPELSLEPHPNVAQELRVTNLDQTAKRSLANFPGSLGGWAFCAFALPFHHVFSFLFFCLMPVCLWI